MSDDQPVRTAPGDPPAARRDRSLTVPLWAARAGWAGTAIAVAVGLDRQATVDHPTALAVAWWLTVGTVLVALAVPGCLGLTLVRCLVPAGIAPVVALLLGTAGGDGPATVASAAGAILVTVTSAVVLSAGFGEAMVQGSAYGHERRLPLRPPVVHAVAIVTTWAVWAAVIAAASVCTALGAVPAAIALTVVAVALGLVLVRTVHRFSRRWLVVVPAGLVVHDHVVLGETLMVTRQSVEAARLAPAGSEALDLTGPAAGYAIEVVVRQALTVLLAPDRRNPRGRAVHALSVLVAPTRPGRALRAAAANRVRVG